jgi:hypothetical protein
MAKIHHANTLGMPGNWTFLRSISSAIVEIMNPGGVNLTLGCTNAHSDWIVLFGLLNKAQNWALKAYFLSFPFWLQLIYNHYNDWILY